MRAVTVLCCVVTFAYLYMVTEVSGLTNAEFYDLIKDYASDVEVFEHGDAIESDVDENDDDVISLPGGPDDELDLEYIADKLDLTKTDKASHQVGWFHRRHHHHHHHHHPKFSCHCHHDSCGCCLTHKFKVNLIFHKIKFKLHACVTVTYLKRNFGFEITFTMNGHRLLHREFSLKHPPALCYGVPGLRRFARICLEFYNINLRTERMCVRIAGKLDLKFKKFRVHLKLGCFKIPIHDEQTLTSLLNDRDFLNVSVQAPSDESEEVEIQDLVAIYRQLQDMDGNEDLTYI